MEISNKKQLIIFAIITFVSCKNAEPPKSWSSLYPMMEREKLMWSQVNVGGTNDTNVTRSGHTVSF